MPIIFLSPSTQEWNSYVTGGNEQEYMNLLADRMEPYLRSSAIEFVRNDPDRNVTGAIADSNAGNYDLHLALHSNAAPENLSGKLRGIDIYYSPSSAASQRAAEIIANNFKEIYPIPARVRAVATTSLGEVSETRAVAVLCEIGYHDNIEDVTWLKNNLTPIAKNLVISLCDYFGIPFVNAGAVRRGIVITSGSGLNIRSFPNTGGRILGSVPQGGTVIVYGQTGNWYVIRYGNITGYAAAEFIEVG